MAFSQVQCLDDSHVNWRSSESKPEFFYSEEQRLALEALVSRGPDAFYEVLKKENIRDFLSELELKKILDTLETYDPGSEYIPRHGGSTGESDGDHNSQGDEQDVAPSLEYWPQRSDRSIPQLDLGWPETIAYRGVTRATVYMQPPIEGQAHIKEVVRKMICQAQKLPLTWACSSCPALPTHRFPPPPRQQHLLSHPGTLLLLSRDRQLSQAAARPRCLHRPHLSLEPLQATGMWQRLMLPCSSPVA